MRHRSILRPLGIFLLLALGWLAIGFVVQDAYWRLMLTLVPIWALLAVAWNIFSGYSGLVSFGHAAFFGAGAYTVGMLAHHGIWNEPISGLVLAAGVAALIGLASGLILLRTTGLTLLMLTLCTMALLEEAAGHLSVAVSALTNMLDVDRVVLGGPFWSRLSEVYLATMPGLLARRSATGGVRSLPVAGTVAGEDVAAIGAACLVLDAVHSPHASTLYLPADPGL